MPLSRWSICSPCCSSKNGIYTTSVFNTNTGKFLFDFDAANQDVIDRLQINPPTPIFDVDFAGNVFIPGQHHNGTIEILGAAAPAGGNNTYTFKISIHPNMTSGIFRFKLRTGIPFLPFVFSNYIPWNAPISQVTAALNQVASFVQFLSGTSLQTGLKYKIKPNANVACVDDFLIDDTTVQILQFIGVPVAGSFDLVIDGNTFTVPYNVAGFTLSSLIAANSNYQAGVDFSIPAQSNLTLDKNPITITYINLKPDTLTLGASHGLIGGQITLTPMPRSTSLIRKFEPTKGAEVLNNGQSIVISDGRNPTAIAVDSNNLTVGLQGEQQYSSLTVGGPSCSLVFTTRCTVGSVGTFTIQVKYHNGPTLTSRPIQYIDNTPGPTLNTPLPNLGLALADVGLSGGIGNQVDVRDNAIPPNLLYRLVDFSAGTNNKQLTNSVDSITITQDSDGFTQVHNGTYGSKIYGLFYPFAPGTPGQNHLTFAYQAQPWTALQTSATIPFDTTTPAGTVQALAQSVAPNITISQTLAGGFQFDTPNNQPFLFGYSYTGSSFNYNSYQFGIHGMGINPVINSPGTIGLPNFGTDAVVVTVNGNQSPLMAITQAVNGVSGSHVAGWDTMITSNFSGQLITRTFGYNTSYETQWDGVSYFTIEIDSYLVDPTKGTLRFYNPTTFTENIPFSGHYLQYPNVKQLCSDGRYVHLLEVVPQGAFGSESGTSYYVDVELQFNSFYAVTARYNKRMIRKIDPISGLIVKSLKYKDITTPLEFTLGTLVAQFNDIKINPFDQLIYVIGINRIVGINSNYGIGYNNEGVSGFALAFCPDGGFWVIKSFTQFIRVDRNGNILVNIQEPNVPGVASFHYVINDLQGNGYLVADSNNIVQSGVELFKSVFKFNMSGVLQWGHKNPLAFYPCTTFPDPYYFAKMSPDYSKIFVHGSRKWKWTSPPTIAQVSDTLHITDSATHV